MVNPSDFLPGPFSNTKVKKAHVGPLDRLGSVQKFSVFRGALGSVGPAPSAPSHVCRQSTDFWRLTWGCSLVPRPPPHTRLRRISLLLEVWTLFWNGWLCLRNFSLEGVLASGGSRSPKGRGDCATIVMSAHLCASSCLTWLSDRLVTLYPLTPIMSSFTCKLPSLWMRKHEL